MPRKNLVHASKPTTPAQECRVPELLRITLQVLCRLSATPARLRHTHDGWRLAAAPLPSGFDYRLLFVIVPGVLILSATVLDYLESSSRRVFLGKTPVSVFIICSDLILVLLSHAFSEIHATEKIKCVVSILKQIQKMDTTLKERLNFMRFRRFKVAILIVYLTWHLLSIVSFLTWVVYTNFIEDSKNHIVICLFTLTGYQHLIIVINQLQWSLTIGEVNSSLTAINNQIKQLLQRKAANPNHIYSTVRCLGQYYETICDMVMQIDKHTGTFFFILFMSKFQKLLTTPYNWLSSLDNKVQVVMQSNWCVYHLINMLVIVEPCHWTQHQLDLTHGLLMRLSRHGHGDDRFTKELNLFILQVQMRGTAFTPLGVFKISRPVIAVILSIVATYLALLMQEQENSELI